jgi:cell division protease FtsH
VFLGRDFNSSKNYSDETAHLIDSEVKRFIDEGYALAKRVLVENMAKLHFIAAYLTKYEVMDAEQFAYAMNNAAVTDEDLLAMIDKRRRVSEEENRIAKEENDAEAAEATDASKPDDDLPEMPTAGTPDGDFPTANDDDK